jgi:hypothetical protein
MGASGFEMSAPFVFFAALFGFIALEPQPSRMS